MHAPAGRPTSLWTVLLVLAPGVAAAAGPDLRLVNAAAERDMPAMRALVSEGADVNTPRADGATALHWAAHWDDLEAVGLLLDAGASANAATDNGVTPLALACENRGAAVVEMLLAAGARTNAAQVGGATPLMTAARTGSVRVVEALLAHGAEVGAATTETRQTALMWATAERHLDVVHMLLAAGADVHRSSTRGFTPLLFAARNGDIETAGALLDAGAGINDAGSDGSQALPLAIISGHDAAARFLLEQGADPDGAVAGVPALHAAAGPVGMWLREWLHSRGIGASGSGTLVNLELHRRHELVRALLASGANPNSRITSPATVQFFTKVQLGAFDTFSNGTGNLRGAPPLWVAAFAVHDERIAFNEEPAGETDGAGRQESGNASYTDIMELLLAAGADPGLTADDGTTPLMAAAGLGHGGGGPRSRRLPSAAKAVRVLVAGGADVNAVNEAGFTALHGAAFRGSNDIVRALVDRGAALDAQDFMGRTPFRIAEGTKQAFGFRESPETARLLRELGADTSLGVPGHILERQLQRDRQQAPASARP